MMPGAKVSSKTFLRASHHLCRLPPTHNEPGAISSPVGNLDNHTPKLEEEPKRRWSRRQQVHPIVSSRPHLPGHHHGILHIYRGMARHHREIPGDWKLISISEYQVPARTSTISQIIPVT